MFGCETGGFKVYDSINKNDKNLFLKSINIKELNRTINDLEINFDCFWLKCKNDNLFAKLVSRNLSINSTRQCSKDENVVLELCNVISSNYGIYITKNPSINGYRPTKNGLILKNIVKDSCLKSFDGIITGKINGYISAKIKRWTSR